MDAEFMNAIFPSSKPNNKQVKERQQQHPNGERGEQLIGLVGNEKQQKYGHPRIGPQLILQYCPDEYNLDQPMKQQIGGGKL